MAGRGAASALVVWLALAGGAGCSPKPQPPATPPLTIVDTTSPLPRVERASKAASAPRRAATPDVEVTQPPETTVGTPAAETTETPPAPAARPLTETDPFRTDSLDGNRFGRQLVKQLLRPPGQEPSDSAATAPTDEP